ncbi:(2Fe-2S)-binding protein [Rhodococcus sp. IEGM 1366]|uniref:(2Fe-2S)-binding protein n=1 Tax=Rhodococcus sp. IEGM 1366 TaxID=3082223 RepID=UPI002955D11C|nr:(2Fe-2S)-binding protein [Rhodococcus sp. IEGM 1366]MDV8070747.1 (2Fe-2S)-binding protein [Rhodococcus sp. IEGM 1366]
MKTDAAIDVNDERCTVDVDPMMPLARFLRESLHLTGTKLVCGEGFCGSCTVLLDGRAVAACLTPVAQAVDHCVRTIESIGPSDKVLTALQNAFVGDDVVQCGMCFPGIAMSLAALLTDNPEPTREDLEIGLAGNLCRCTGYTRLLDTISTTLVRLCEEAVRS